MLPQIRHNLALGDDANAEAFLPWQAHVDAGRIGQRLPTPPEVAANRDATTALFRAIANDRRRLERAK